MAITRTGKWQGRALALVGSAIIGLLAVWISGFRLDSLHAKKDTDTSTPPLVARVPARTEAQKAIRATNAEAQKTLPGTDSSVSQHPQPLILTGTLVGRNLNEGSAFIGTSASNPQTYQAGAMLANGARLTEIGHNYVVLERDGRSVKLYAQNAKGMREARHADDALLMIGGRQKTEPAVPTDSDPITDFIRPTPVFDGATIVGYQVYAGERAGTFARLGLRSGDIITSIDGSPLADGQTAMESLRPLTTGASVTVNVKRDGGNAHIVLDGSIVAADLQHSKKTADASLASGAPGSM
jgi:type II secretion system protein C